MTSNPTLIETLHAAWRDTNENYARNDEALSAPDARGRLAHTQALTALHMQAEQIARVILRAMPTSHADAVIVAEHMVNATDLIASGLPIASEEDHDINAIEIASENLFVFLAREWAREKGLTPRHDPTFARVDARAGKPPFETGEARHG